MLLRCGGCNLNSWVLELMKRELSSGTLLTTDKGGQPYPVPVAVPVLTELIPQNCEPNKHILPYIASCPIF